MEIEYPAWRLILDKGLSKSEIDSWGLDDLDKANAFIDMQNDYDLAQNGFARRDEDK